MREIKFRAWHEDSRQMCMDFPILKEDIPISLNEIISWNDDYNFMQFTGLHDKNGKEIYEADIVVGSSGNIKYLVKWEVDRYYPSMLEHSTVIGNVYENPELTK